MNGRARLPSIRAALGCASIFLAAIGPVPAYAQAPAHPDVQLGRLFFTPQQRLELDQRRALNIREAPIVRNQGALTVDGHVSRSSGKTTTWVNGAPQHDAYRPRTPDTVAIVPAEAGRTVPVRVGQTLDKASATITDRLHGGTVRVERGTRGAR
jgi:hypothetical protein